MNDTELDELLNAWRTPPVPSSLRESVRSGIAANQKWRRLTPGWRSLIATVAVGAIAIVLVENSASSKQLNPPPYTVDSEITLYQGTRGCPECWMDAGPKNTVMTSYNEAGSEELLAWSAPDHRLEAALWAARLAVSNAVEAIRRNFLLTPDEEADNFAVVYATAGKSWVVGERSTLLNSGCRPSDRRGEVIGQEIILEHPTMAARHNYWQTRMTLWMAPELSCFALRATVEVQQPDGTWKLVSEKRAVKVTVNR
jgi:hypothetical protein